jgi:hypothetical protein
MWGVRVLAAVAGAPEGEIGRAKLDKGFRDEELER